MLFTLGLLAVYRLGNHVPTPGINAQALIDFFEQNRGNWFGLVDMFSGGNLAQGHRLRPGHHAVHLGLDHPAAADGGLALSGEALQGRRARPAQDHPVHPLRHGAPLHHPVVRHRGLPRADDPHQPVQDRGAPGLGLQAHDHAHPDHRHRLHHVAGRADHRARDRQRHEPDHLRRHRGRLPPRRPRHLPDDPARRADPARRPPPARLDGRGGGGDRVRRARPAADPGPVREARGRPARLRRAAHPPAAPRQHLGRHPGHLRLLDHRLPADDRIRSSRPTTPGCRRSRSSSAGACRSTTCSTSRSSSSSATSTPRSSSTPTTWRRTCGSTGASSPASARASAPRSTSTTSSGASPSAARSTSRSSPSCPSSSSPASRSRPSP